MTGDQHRQNGLQAARILAELGDPDADLDRPHLVMVSDPEMNPRWHEFYGPYDTAVEAAAGVEVIRRTADIGGAEAVWTYPVHPLRPKP